MVPRRCRCKWRSGGLKARTPAGACCCPCSIRAACRPGRTGPSTVAFWGRKRRGAGARSRRRPPFLHRGLRAWCTQTTCGVPRMRSRGALQATPPLTQGHASTHPGPRPPDPGPPFFQYLHERHDFTFIFSTRKDSSSGIPAHWFTLKCVSKPHSFTFIRFQSQHVLAVRP